MVYPPYIPKPSSRREEEGWPQSTPIPAVPAEELGKILKQILDRLDAIEKRLDNIEKLLAQSCQCSNYDELVTCACANGFKPI